MLLRANHRRCNVPFFQDPMKLSHFTKAMCGYIFLHFRLVWTQKTVEMANHLHLISSGASLLSLQRLIGGENWIIVYIARRIFLHRMTIEFNGLLNFQRNFLWIQLNFILSYLKSVYFVSPFLISFFLFFFSFSFQVNTHQPFIFLIKELKSIGVTLSQCSFLTSFGLKKKTFIIAQLVSIHDNGRLSTPIIINTKTVIWIDNRVVKYYFLFCENTFIHREK